MIGYSIEVFPNVSGLVKSDYLMSILENSLSFTYDFQRHLQEMTQTNVTWVAGKAYLVSLTWLNWFYLLRELLSLFYILLYHHSGANRSTSSKCFSIK